MTALKRLFCVLAAIVIFPGCHTVFAAEVFSLAADNVRCSGRGTAQVDIVSKNSVKIFAFTLDIACSDTEVEFVKAEKYGDGKISHHSENGRTKLVYYCKNGRSLSVNDKLFTLRFKSQSRTGFSLNFSISQCVNGDAEFMDSGGNFSCTASFTNASGYSETANGSSRKADKRVKTSAAGNPKQNKPEKPSLPGNDPQQTPPALNGIDNDYAPKQDFDAAVPIIIGGFSVIIAGLSAALVFQQLAKKRAEKQNEPPRDSGEDIE